MQGNFKNVREQLCSDSRAFQGRYSTRRNEEKLANVFGSFEKHLEHNAFNVTILHFKLNFKIFISDLNTHQAHLANRQHHAPCSNKQIHSSSQISTCCSARGIFNTRIKVPRIRY